MKKLILLNVGLMIVFAAAAMSVSAQRETATGLAIEKDIELLRRDLRSEMKKIIAMNVPLTADEATKFWPVYDEYTVAMTKHNDEFYAVVKDYATNQKTLTDAQAISMMNRWIDSQVKQAQTRQKFVPIFEKVIPGKKAALFFQIDRRLYVLKDLQVVSEIPLVAQ